MFLLYLIWSNRSKSGVSRALPSFLKHDNFWRKNYHILPFWEKNAPLPKKIPPLQSPNFKCACCQCYMDWYQDLHHEDPSHRLQVSLPQKKCKYPCLRRSPTSGDQPMTHPAPVSGPKLITTRQLGYFPYHPNNNKTITSKRKMFSHYCYKVMIKQVGWSNPAEMKCAEFK